VEPKYEAIKTRLRAWGGYCRGGVYLGLPRRSVLQQFMGRGIRPPPLDNLPPDIQEIEDAVRKAPDEHKRLLVTVYCKDGTMKEKAIRLGVSRRALFRQLDNAVMTIAVLVGY